MKIDTSTWKWFQLGGDDGLFDIRKGKRLTSEDQTEGNTPYIGAIDSNNGVSNYIGQEPIHEGNTISLSYNGSVGEAFYQPLPYWATDDVNALYLRPEYGTLCPATGLFVCSVLKHDKYRYSYGRKWTLDNMKATKVKLPATSDGKPDWQWMESYIDSLHSKALTSANAVGNGFRLNTEDWREFLLADYFDIVPGKYHYPDEYEEGNTPYYSATNENNGIAQNISLKPDFSGNCIVTGKIGCTAFYVPDNFCATSDVNIFKPKFCMTPYIGLFVASVINLSENYKWAYGRQCRVGNSKKIRIKLPATPDGKPDWQWMESYIKSLPYGDRLQ